MSKACEHIVFYCLKSEVGCKTGQESHDGGSLSSRGTETSDKMNQKLEYDLQTYSVTLLGKSPTIVPSVLLFFGFSWHNKSDVRPEEKVPREA